jgi:dihydroorotate dehydrogenase (fumarate)
MLAVSAALNLKAAAYCPEHKHRLSLQESTQNIIFLCQCFHDMASLFGTTATSQKPLLLNSASPWATTKEELSDLFDCASTIAVTTRTSTLTGFKHDDAIHQRCFFDPCTNSVHEDPPAGIPASTLNTLGYSPLPLDTYLSFIEEIVNTRQHAISDQASPKPFIVSVTGSATEVSKCAALVSACSSKLNDYPIHMEINLSCPNIAGKPPPAYSKESLIEYLQALEATAQVMNRSIKCGIKTPPYTHAGQFQDIEDALLASAAGGHGKCPIAFVTATNTLGSCLVLGEQALGEHELSPVLQSADGTGIGGMAGPSIHALSLGNVARLRQLLDGHDQLRAIEIIGVGGVVDLQGYRRMRAAGAMAVALATALGQQGVGVFEKIASAEGPESMRPRDS